MENPTENSRGNPPPTPVAELERLAAALAAKHADGPSSRPPFPTVARPRSNAGRKSAEAETAAYLARNHLRAVPDDGMGDTEPPPSVAEESSSTTAPPPPPPPISPEFVRTAAETLLTGIEAWRQKQVAQATLKICNDTALAKELSAEAAAPPGCIDVMTLSIVEIVGKYQLLATWTPEAMLCISAIVWIGKDLALHKRLTELAKIKSAQPDKRPA